MAAPRWIESLRPAHEQRMFLLAMAAGLPAVIIALVLLWTGSYVPRVQWTLTILIVLVWWGCAGAVRERVASPLRTLSNLLEAMREGDYSIRARAALHEDAMGDVMTQLNAMGATLRAQRLGALEATTLLRKVMEEIDVAVFAFDAENRLRLVNRAGEKLLGRPAERMLNDGADALGLGEYLAGDETQTVQRTFPSGAGRWGIHRSQFREGGLPHHMLVVSDLTRALREEELQAWQRLVRVLGHELNNSLTPIKSIAGSLETMLQRNGQLGSSNASDAEWKEDARRGLSIIASRSESLSRFMGAYARLAKLPRPNLAPMNVAAWVQQAVGLEQRMAVTVEPGPAIEIQGDRDQLEQTLINLLRNAVEASLETQGGVTISWNRQGSLLEVLIEDEGPGLSNTANLFVPFFTTKPGGSGIGLVLSRQIAEAHGGTLDLANRAQGTGCVARLTLPI